MQLQLKSTDAVQNVNPSNQLKSNVKVMKLDLLVQCVCHVPKCPLKVHKQVTMLSVVYYLTLHIVWIPKNESWDLYTCVAMQ